MKISYSPEALDDLKFIKEDIENQYGKIVRPLWLNQGFFVEDVTGEKYHELCIYFLIDISNTDLLEKGNRFRLIEREHTHDFEWIEFERLQDEYIYPVFIKKKIFDLPDYLVLQDEHK